MTDDDLPQAVANIEEDVAPTQKLTLWIVFGDFLNNLGSLIEALATFPNDLCLRVQGHVKWKKSRELDMAEAARTIEQLEQHANGGTSAQG